MGTAVVKLHTYMLTASVTSAREAAQTQTSTVNTEEVSPESILT